MATKPSVHCPSGHPGLPGPVGPLLYIQTVQSYRVTKVRQVFIKTSLEDARHMGYTIMKEQVDKETIRKLYSEGVLIPDVVETEYVKITEK